MMKKENITLCLIRSGARNLPKLYYEEGLRQIWLDDLNCQGNETSLTSCFARPIGQNDCGHSDDVGVECHGKGYFFLSLVETQL